MGLLVLMRQGITHAQLSPLHYVVGACLSSYNLIKKNRESFKSLDRPLVDARLI